MYADTRGKYIVKVVLKQGPNFRSVNSTRCPVSMKYILSVFSADWLIAAHGCFKFNYTLCTIYTNLGVDGVMHGISQTDCPVVIVSQELLPKLESILPKLPNVETII